MRICVYGLGAIGGLFAARLVAAGASVSAVARGETLRALRQGGLSLHEAPGSVSRPPVRVPLAAAEDPSELGEHDLVVVSVKTTGLLDAARRIAPLLGPQTIVLSAMNGVPWWFFHGLDPALAAREWHSIDPGREIAKAIPAERVLGCVVHLACWTSAPGVVHHASGNRLIIGEPSGALGERSERVAGCLRRAGFEVEMSRRIQQDVWFKLWGNMTMNPISAITGATLDRVLDDPLVRAFVSATMREASTLGERIGLPIETTPEQRHEVTRRLGAFRTSMLQDVEAGKPIELDALVAIVAEIGRAVGIATPNVDTLLGLTRLHARTLGLYPPAPQ